MSERDRLVAIVQSLTRVRQATQSNPLLRQLIGMAVLEASECLVRAGFEPEGLPYLGVDEEIAYLVEVKRPSCASGSGTPGPARGIPHLRLVRA